MQRRRGLAILATAALPLSLLPISLVALTGTTSGAVEPGTGAFDRVATYPVFQNVPAGVDPAAATVAEISAVSEDGKTVIYTDALGKRVGFLDITDPAAPRGLGTIELATLGHADDQPTSVAVVGDFALIAIDETGGDFPNPKGSLVIVRISTREKVRTIDLGGQPDSIAISPDKAYAAIAMENQRDEEATPAGGAKGALPQAPAGFVQLLDLPSTTDPAAWSTRAVVLDEPTLAAAGLDTPSDPEPEYVTINADNKLALTLQENNGIVVIDVPTGDIDTVFSAGTATVTGVDVTKDGVFNPTGTVTAPREPDSIGWVDATHVATANEGDWKGGTRGWTIFDTTTGAPVWDAKNSYENLATSLGLHNNDRAAKKGAEPEGLLISTIGGRKRAFVGSERSNFVAVYDLTNPAKPVFEQALPATNGPEGLLAIPARNLLVVSSETDDASVLVRASVGVYAFGDTAPAFPSIVSAEESSGFPIGWGALGALSAAPGNSEALWSASDSAYKFARLYKIDTSSAPAVIDRVVEVKNADGTLATGLDVEGLHARSGGGFWLASEGATGAQDKLVRTDSRGVVQQEVPLPADVAAKVGKWGFEGVTATGSGSSEVVYAVLQRPLFNDIATTTPAEGNNARIGRYDVAAGTWSWFSYPLQTTTTAGDWIGLSEITAVDADTLAVIERDKLNGTTAAVKRVYTVDVPATGGTTTPVALTKKLAIDVLPHLRALKGWTQEKLEGLTIGADGQVYAVTDNDGLKDATGETQLLRLGSAAAAFDPAPTTPPTTPPTTSPTPTPTPTPAPVTKAESKVSATVKDLAGAKVRVVAKVRPGTATGKVRVVLKKAGKAVAERTARLEDGRTALTLRVRADRYKVVVTYLGDDGHRRSTSVERVTLR
ncbi:hypothetical protein J2X46_001423 [Nocardioides sp. BE266]|uniref:esterase-like activity of phytase family protein n=1 Tax=Nocardioides sp. BE266 TaxID=2817725 RepID=UPI0028664764|nr:esterase-like activity of phytase family protein [Nocardioides sp. BE266]MDR7252447.1 hypothetical protein [Nocardioides sp. BE266]